MKWGCKIEIDDCETPLVETGMRAQLLHLCGFYHPHPIPQAPRHLSQTLKALLKIS